MKNISAVSVVIRARNEAKELAALLEALAWQDHPGKIEVIVVDNASSDDTVKVAVSYGAKVVNLPAGEFTYPKSMNLGVAAASFELVVLTVAHALPVSKHWLSDAILNFQNSPWVAGVFGHCLPGKNATWPEMITYYPNYLFDRMRGKRLVQKREIGIMSATNCVLRRSLWKDRPFDESFELGGEDGDWALWALSHGYQIIFDPAFTVYHSHGLGAWDLWKQFRYWSRLARPSKFSYQSLSFRGPDFHKKFFQ